jgi:hypothetical protein
MNHRRSLRCLCAAPAAEQGSAAARLAPGSRARIARAEGVAASSVAEEMGRLKVPVSVSGIPRPEQLSALRDALTGAGAGVIVTRGASATVLLGLPSARLAPADANGAAPTEIQDVVLSMEYDIAPGAP